MSSQPGYVAMLLIAELHQPEGRKDERVFVFCASGAVLFVSGFRHPRQRREARLSKSRRMNFNLPRGRLETFGSPRLWINLSVFLITSFDRGAHTYTIGAQLFNGEA